MPRRPIEIKKGSNKNAKQNYNCNAENNNVIKNQVIPSSPSPRRLDTSKKEKKIKRKSSQLRRLLSISIITYLGYYVVYGCGSPFDSNTSDKSAICEPIDTLKLDVYSLFDSTSFKDNINPYIIDPLKINYQQYAVPIQKKSQDFLKRFGTPCHQKAKHMYDQTIAPRVDQVTLSLFVQKNQKYVQELYNDKLTPWMEQTKKVYQTTRNALYKRYQELPPSLLKKLEQVKAMYIEAESKELKPVLVGYYWTFTNFYKDQFRPWALHNKYASQIQNWMIQNTMIQRYRHQFQSNYQRYVEPFTAKLNEKLHLSQLREHLSRILPQQKQTSDSTMSKAIHTIKEKLEKENPVIAAKITSKPIFSRAVDSIKAQVQKAKDEQSAPSPVVVAPIEKIEQVEDQAILL